MKTKYSIKPILMILIIMGLGITAWSNINSIYNYIYKSTLDFDLYKNEAYEGGTRESELKSFIEAGIKVANAQSKLQEKFPDQKKHRVFHAKQHACLTGKLNLILYRPLDVNQETYVGLFSGNEEKSFDFIARYSNGLGFIQHDKLPDVRGLAIKVLNVKSEQTGEVKNIDLLTTNSPTPAAKNLNDFIDFMEAVVDHGPNVGLPLFLSKHPSSAKSLISATGILPYKIKSLATTQFWSGHPYLLGPNKAMKFTFIPVQKNEPRLFDITDMGKNYLRKELAERLSKNQVKYILALQLEIDAIKTPIENNLVEWKVEDSPVIPVAELVFEKQNIISESGEVSNKIDEVCENLAFTPGNYIPEHRPLSNMGRGRLFAYEVSQLGRQVQLNNQTIETVNSLRKLSKAEVK